MDHCLGERFQIRIHLGNSQALVAGLAEWINMNLLTKRRLISPPREQLDQLRQPLMAGERRVLEFFDRTLDPEWEIYIQPHLNGLRPDFVLLHPHVGIAVFEVKDWDLHAMKRWMETPPGKAPILMGEKDGGRFSLQKDNPVEKIWQYKQELLQLYCPGIPKEQGVVITAGIIFPFAEDIQIQALLKPALNYRNMENRKYYPVSGSNSLSSENASLVFPGSVWSTSKYMKPEYAANLRVWLTEPDAPQTQRTPLPLDKKQQELVTTRTRSGFRRITGPAGSGKSMVIAARAAYLAARDKEVLIVTYNLTLINYLRDLAVRAYPGASQKITFLNFHCWCKRLCLKNGKIEEYNDIWKEKAVFPEIALCQLVEEILDSLGEAKHSYDAVLVDEGQDFKPEWWTLLRKICRPEGERLLAADETQDIYGNNRLWSQEEKRLAGFSGNWIRLENAYRLPAAMIPHLKHFADVFLTDYKNDLPQPLPLELAFFPAYLQWKQVEPSQIIDSAFSVIHDLIAKECGVTLHASDITVLTDTNKTGNSLVQKLEYQNIKCIHTFPDTNISDRNEYYRDKRRKKMYFFMGDARLKVTTLHSFKGWESRVLILILEQAKTPRDLALVYTGLTRLKKHADGSLLTVICAAPELAAYGRSWK